MTVLAMALLAVAGVILAIRLVVGPSVADRIVASDGLLTVVIGMLAADAARTGDTVFVDVALVIGLLAFVGTGIAARFIEQRGA